MEQENWCWFFKLLLPISESRHSAPFDSKLWTAQTASRRAFSLVYYGRLGLSFFSIARLSVYTLSAHLEKAFERCSIVQAEVDHAVGSL